MSMPLDCGGCSPASCCLTARPWFPVEERHPEDPYQEFARIFYDPRNRLGYWGARAAPATRARARVTRTRGNDA